MAFERTVEAIAKNVGRDFTAILSRGSGSILFLKSNFKAYLELLKTQVLTTFAAKTFALVLCLFFLPELVLAQAVLPKGVWHPRLIYGTVTEVSSEFGDEGGLNNIGRYNQTFDSDFLKKFVKDFDTLANLLNDYSPGYNLGDEINLGSLVFSGGPEISYTAPVLAYGFSNAWTIGIGIPVVSMKGTVQIEQVGENNSDEIYSQVTNGSVPVHAGFENAFETMSSIDLKSRFHSTLKDKGYEPLEAKDESVLGDVQVFSFYQYHQSDRTNLYFQTLINLPTGPQDDPDDLMDFPNFHQFGIQLKSHHDFLMTSQMTLSTSIGYFWKAPDTIEKRVPLNESDFLPDEDRKEVLNRDLGDILSADLGLSFKATDFLSVNGGLQAAYKSEDYYDGGNPESDYSLLSRETESNWVQGKLGAMFSTVEWFKQGQSKIPFMIGYSYSDLINGRNVVRQVRHEASLLMFF